MNKSNYGNSGNPPRRINWGLIIIGVCVAAIVIWGIVGLSRLSSQNREDVMIKTNHIPGLDNVKAVKGTEWPVREYEGFRLAFNEQRHTPVWVSWELLATETDGPESRYKTFWQDEEVYGCPSTADYKNSGYDRGHMCPSADQKWSADAMRDCFVMANMTPQDHELNAGAWATLEKKERVWAERDSAIVIVAGPIYTPVDTKRIGDTGVSVPGAFFKVLLAPYLTKPRAIGFIFPNAKSPGNMQDYAVSVDRVEELTGLDFFSALPDDIENDVESRYSFTEWNGR
ncbi:MAG: DNA/RNA non-specific endonuclease [Muribaculaceae bacterium]|nr:DNA/RNA non-specific endonuclease [Muribaculaceae bacterium]